MAIFLACSTSGITSGEKVCRELKMAAILKILKYWTQLQFDLRYEKIVRNYAKKGIFHDDDVIDDVTGWLRIRPSIFFYKWNNNIFHDNKKRAKKSLWNLICISTMRLWLHLYKYIFMTSLMTSPDHKRCQILKLIFLRQYLSYSVDQKLKMSEMLMAIFFGIFNFRYNFRWKSLSRAQNGGHFENSDKLNTASIWLQIWKDRPKLCTKFFFHGDEVIGDVTGWPQSFPLYSCLGEVCSGSKLQGQCLVNKCKYHNCLSRLYMPKDDLNE